MPTQKELLAKLALVNTKQNKLTAGNGININQSTDTITGQTYSQTYTPTNPATGFKIGSLTNLDGSTTDVRVPDPDFRELTQSQYDALPATKNYDGVAYFITDKPAIQIWIGSAQEYLNLTLAEKMKPNVLYCIRQTPQNEGE